MSLRGVFELRANPVEPDPNVAIDNPTAAATVGAQIRSVAEPDRHPVDRRQGAAGHVLCWQLAGHATAGRTGLSSTCATSRATGEPVDPDPGAWEAKDRDDLISILLDSWFEDDDEIEAVESVESDSVADRERVGYRFRVKNSDGRHLVEQQAYLADLDGQISWMRVVCSGFRPAGPAE